MTGTVLFPKYFPENILMHLCTNDFNFREYCRLGKSEIAKINVFNCGPKTVKIRNKAKLEGLLHVRLREVFPSIYVFI